MRDLAITAVVSLLIILGGWRFLAYQNGSPASATSPVLKTETENVAASTTPTTAATKSTTPKQETTSSLSSGPISIKVSSQAVGKAVLVDELVTTKPVWIAIHADNNGVPAGVLGARYFTASGKSISVGLLRPTEVGTYHAVLHTDNGNIKYATKEDPVLNGSDGKPVAVTFKVY